MKEIILAIGNIMNGDDGIGSYIVEKVKRYVCEADQEAEKAATHSSLEEIMTIDCGTIPENYTSAIRKQKPDRLVLVDAAEMGLSSGSYRIIEKEHMGVTTMSTHNMPLSLFASYVSQFCREVLLLGIQPKRMDLNTKMSPELYMAGNEIALLIVKRRLSDIIIYHP